MSRRLAVAGLLAGVALTAPGCGGDDPAPGPTPPESATTTSATPTGSAGAEPETSPTGATASVIPDLGPPTDAPVADFCDAYGALADPGDPGDTAGPATDGDAVAELKAAARRLKRVGTPSDAPDDGRAGLLVLLDLVADLPPDATPAQLDRVGDGLGAADQESFIAFTTYAATTCPTPAG